jgi:hypothetical protein
MDEERDKSDSTDHGWIREEEKKGQSGSGSSGSNS